jgi:hypothetical protein
METLPTLLPFLGAVLGAMIGATVSPLVQWQIEKKKQKLTYKRDLITRWRKMLEEIAREHKDKWANEEHPISLRHRDLLLKYGDFTSLVMYAEHPDNISKSEWKDRREAGEKYGIPPLLMHYMWEVHLLEKRWNLL